MLRHLYRQNPGKLSHVLNAVLDRDEGLDVGVKFRQQFKTSRSLPDGGISQPGWDLRIEVKPNDGWDLGQLQRHADGFTPEENSGIQCELLLLSTDAHAKPDLVLKTGVALSVTTFQDLVNAIADKAVIADHEIELKEIFDDFVEILAGNDLLPNPYLLFAFNCARSMAWNLKHKSYYEPADRPTKLHVLNGFYGDKSIQAIGRADFTTIVEFQSGVSSSEPSFVDFELDPNLKHGDFTEYDVQAWLDGIEFPSDLDGQYRIYKYSEDSFVNLSADEDRFRKSTNGGYQSGVWLNLKSYVEAIRSESQNVRSVGEAVKGRSFGHDRGFKS